MSENTTTTAVATTDRKRGRGALLAAGAAGTIGLALAASGTLSAFTASITNDTNTGGVGALTMRETGPDGTGATVNCDTTVTQTSQTCSTINKFGGSLTMASGASKTTDISITNTGTMAATSFTLAPGACTLTNTVNNTGDLCSTALVTVVQDGTTIVNGLTPAAIASGSYTLTPVAAGASSNLSITFAIPASAPNSVTGESVSQPLTWTFNA